MQQGAGGNGLNRFPQAHFVGEQRPLGERQMQHAFPLIRKERNLRLVRGPFATLDFELIFAPQLLALERLLSRSQPGAKLLGQAQVGQICRSHLPQRFQGFFGRGLL